MTIQVIRKDGNVRGIALLLGNARILATSGEKAEYWRTCDHCVDREAIVFCRAHAQYVCEKDLPAHSTAGVCSFHFLFHYRRFRCAGRALPHRGLVKARLAS